MRFLGNKESLAQTIKEFIFLHVPHIDNHTVLFDAFCGTGSVSDAFKSDCSLVINDNLKWSTIYSYGRLVACRCLFKDLGFDPFEFFNNSTEARQDFIYKNYSPAGSNRMYFSAENAGRIDYFRWQIEEWFKNNSISREEYCYLLSSLLESVSKVSNTAGVYGAFLKKWDQRALKPIEFIKPAFLNSEYNDIRVLNDKIENIIEDVDCDILYLDPPYTQNQYGTQYHMFETIVLNDNPTISKITGSRPVTPMKSDWSKEYSVNILLDKVLAKTKAKYIVLSYSNDGFLSQKYIEAAFKRYGKPETYVCQRISYKKYENWKSTNKAEHFEYLFFVEKKDKEDVVYESPLNYIGNKVKVVPDIKRSLPKDIATFIDCFGGGFNVGINVSAKHVIYNDNNVFVSDLIGMLRNEDTVHLIKKINVNINKYSLEKGNAKTYLKAREDYNNCPVVKRDPVLLLTIIFYGYQQQIRFNSDWGFNNPVGVRWFNDRILEKLISFSRRIKEVECNIHKADYVDILKSPNKDNFYYFDPPYLLTKGSYNDGKRGFKGWDKKLEQEMFENLNKLDKLGCKFMLSYVLEHKGKKNSDLEKWIAENHYRIIQLGKILGISGSRRKEVLIINYEISK